MFKAADRDGSGALNMREVYAVVKNSAQLRRTAGLLKKLLAGAIAVIAVLIACIGGMTAGLLDAYKDTEASGAFLSSRDGRVMQTSPAEYRVPDGRAGPPGGAPRAGRIPHRRVRRRGVREQRDRRRGRGVPRDEPRHPRQ